MATGTIQKNKYAIEVIKNVNHTTDSANVYQYAYTFTISEPSIIKVEGSYTDSSPLGIAISSLNNISGAVARTEQDAGSRISATTFLPEGTYYVLAKYNSTGTNNIKVSKLVFD